MTPERKLWQAVVVQALVDALDTTTRTQDRINERGVARTWLEDGRRDFRAVCDMAGMDSDFVRDTYLAGKVDVNVLVGERGYRAHRRNRPTINADPEKIAREWPTAKKSHHEGRNQGRALTGQHSASESVVSGYHKAEGGES